ncbi:MAG: SLBB domain-containing protein [Bacteroidaceae bacterium]|nr:SLBB domain-containing protein [Bacteroidaceae bacterium]
MLKKSLFLGLMLLCLSTTSMAQMGGMNDKQVLEYVQNVLKQGKTQKQIASELARRGVTRAQAERVKKLYEESLKGNGTSEDTKMERLRIDEGGSIATEKEYISEDFDFAESPKEEKREDNNAVFGRNIFNTHNLTFEPSANLPTPPNYRLGAGDQVIIDIWGANQISIQETISPDGAININNIGMIYLNGMTVSQAAEHLRHKMNKIYAGLSDENPTSHLKLTLGNTRTIQINVMGEVLRPGTYALSAFSTVFHALYRAGGVSNIGSMRDIQVVRNGKNVAQVDVYDFIMHGKTNDDIKLQEGDVIIVSPYEALVKIEGNVKRPMRYEMKKDETVATLLKYAGNFSSDAYTRSMKLIRQNGKEYQLFTIDDIDYSGFKLADGDVLTVDGILERFENKLEIKGAVYRPGIYQLGADLQTLKELVAKADGLMEEAFLTRAVLNRQHEDMTREVIQVDMKGIMNGTKPDIALKRNDVLYIPSIHDLQNLGNVEVFGEVARPGKFIYADNMTLEDLIIQAGGLLESASTIKVDVSRRIKNPKSTSSTAEISEMFTFALKDGFVIDGEVGFTLKPFDQVFVRKSPTYKAQVNVSVDGEIEYAGTYALTNKSERLSDLVKKAGGLNKFAYANGAKLIRKANDEEISRMKSVVNMMERELGEKIVDSLNINIEHVYSVGIDLVSALENPGGDADIVLREGDRLTIPEMTNTVKINGAVMMPNTITYNRDMSVKDYIGQAGGYSNGARKSKAFVIYMNGQIAKVKKSDKAKIQPGCEIIVPAKNKTNNSKWNIQTILALASSLGSLGLTAASIANILK